MNLNTISRGIMASAVALTIMATMGQAAETRVEPASGAASTAIQTGMDPYAYPTDGSNAVVPAPLIERDEKDARLTRQVKQALEPSYSGISVDTEEGTVRLRGNVDSLQDRDAIIKDVRSVGGVQSVESYIRVTKK